MDAPENDRTIQKNLFATRTTGFSTAARAAANARGANASSRSRAATFTTSAATRGATSTGGRGNEAYSG